MSLIEFTNKGIWIPKAQAFIDPIYPVDRAIITHAHADHARRGMSNYLCSVSSVPILSHRLGKQSKIRGLSYGKSIDMHGVKFSFHPAGHIVGSAQIRIEYKGEIWVVSGDYKLEKDGISEAFESVKCHHFITETTFGNETFNWEKAEIIHDQINEWWADNQKTGVTSILFCYSLGKAQRILKHLNQFIGRIFVHGSIYNTNKVLIQQGIPIKHAEKANNQIHSNLYKGSMVLAPPRAFKSEWMRKFKNYKSAMVSGWTLNNRSPDMHDRWFALSDHADWKALNEAVKSSEAQNIYTHHGYSDYFADHLNREGYNARAIRFE